MSWLGRILGYSRTAADDNPYRAKLGHVTVEAVRTFNALLNTFSKTFDFRYDEALREDPQFALKMRRDPFLRALLQERLMPLTRWKWALKPEDPEHKSQAERARWYEDVVRATPRFSKQQLYLGHAAWYGRYGSQFALVDDVIQGELCKRVGRHIPVNGDKLVFDWDGFTPGVRINQSVVNQYPKENITYDNRGGPILMLRDPQHRSQFIVHVHELDDADYFEPEMAGRVCGIGLRDFAYYGAFLRSKMIQWAVAFMEKVGTLGLLIFYYPEGNDGARKQAEASAKAAGNRTALAVPIPKGGDRKAAGAELLPANMSGVQFLTDIISGWWERNIERLFVGQSMSAGADNESGLGGSGRAELAKDTKFNLLQFDARGQEETYTTDLLPTLLAANGDAGWKLRFEYVLPDPEAEAKLNAITKAATLPGAKLEYKAAELRELTGMSEPGPDDETVGGEDPMAPGVGGNGMPMPGADAINGVANSNRADAESQHKMASADRDFAAGREDKAFERELAVAGNAGDGAARPHPEAEALVLAMATAAEEGDAQALDALADLADDEEGLADLIADLEADDDEPAPPVAPYAWSAGQSRNNKLVAIGSGEHAGKKLYGKRAEAALRAQQKRSNPEPTQRQRRAAESAARRKQKADANTTAMNVVGKATGDPKSLTAGDFDSLREHLKSLTKEQAKSFARSIREKVSGTKQELADRILSYVKTGKSTGKKTDPKPKGKKEPEPKAPEIDYRQKNADAPIAKSIVVDRAARAVMDQLWPEAARVSAARAEVMRLEKENDALFGAYITLMDSAPPFPQPGGDDYQDRMKAWRAHAKKEKEAHKRYQAASDALVKTRDRWLESAPKMRAALEKALAHDTPSQVSGAFKRDLGPAVNSLDAGRNIKPLADTPAARRVVDEAARFVAAVCANLETKVVYGAAADGRAFARRDGLKPGTHEVALGALADPAGASEAYLDALTRTQVHELGHCIEFDKPGVEKLAQEFLAYRCGDEQPTRLRDKFGAHYQEYEVGRKDDFERVFGEGSSSAYYVGKIYPQGSTEVISMGLEQLYYDPAGFITADPEYAQFIFKVLTM